MQLMSMEVAMYPKRSSAKGSGLIPALLLLAAMLLVLAEPAPAAQLLTSLQ
jgi:hypothetical protein